MAFRDVLASIFGSRGGSYPQIVYSGPSVSEVLNYTAGDLYRTQPHLRTVVSFLSRSVAQLRLQTFQRVSDTDRKRVTDDPFVRLITGPNPAQTQYELFESLVSELCLYDNAYWFVAPSSETSSGWIIRPIPAAWLSRVKKSSAFYVDSYEFNIDDRAVEVKAENVIHFHGWNPGSTTEGVSPVEALKQVLSEQLQAWSFREQMWKRGGRVGMYLYRPAEAPEWSPESREKFARMWSEFSSQGSRAGATPVLEDGTELRKIGFSAKEDEWVEASKLSLATVAGVYQVNPVMVGILDNANFSNTQAFRKMLYSDTLGPLLRMIEDRINTFLLPRITETDNSYTEFNIQAKLAGDFEEQAAILSTSTGGPWMTRNEARARQNLPSIDGGDELIVPLNVIEGGQASPQDSAPEPADTVGKSKSVSIMSPRQVSVKATVSDDVTEELEGKLSDFFDHQGRSVLSKIGSAKSSGVSLKEGSWWDEDRWNKSLQALISQSGLGISELAAVSALKDAGLSGGDYDPDRTLEYISVISLSDAEFINRATKNRLDRSLSSDSSMTPESVIDWNKGSRAKSIAAGLVTSFSSFGTVESARQVGGPKATKTWIHNSGKDARPEHVRMGGETVGIDENFSNGARWTGDDPSGADGNAFCACSTQVNYIL